MKRDTVPIARGVARAHDVAVVRGRGALLFDAKGRRYLDFAGGIGTMNVGHCHPKVVAAVRAQAGRLTHACAHVVRTPGYEEVCAELVKAAPGTFLKKAALFNSGAEAVENAVKIARRFTGRSAVVAFDLGFHGRTLLGMTLTGKERPYKVGFGPFAPEVYHTPYPYPYRTPAGVAPGQAGAYALERLSEFFHTQADPSRVAAVIVEPVLGEGGFIVPPPDFLPGLRRLCDKHGILLILDEIQTGFGRTGTMFAAEHSGVAGDLMTTAKSLAGGLPLSAVVGRAEVMDAPDPGGIGGTYGGNPVACAAALAVFKIFEQERLLERARRMGALLEARLCSWARDLSCVGEARGLGAMWAVELVCERAAKTPLPEAAMKAVIHACAERGLLALKAGMYGNVLRILAPLVATDAQMKEGLDIMETVLSQIPAR